MRLCSIDGCDLPHKARGWCSTHWARWRRHGNPHTVLADVPRRPKSDRKCGKRGCDDDHYARGMCAKHYRRWQRAEDVAAGIEAPDACIDCGADPYPGGCLRCEPCMRADLQRRRDSRRAPSWAPDPSRVGVKQVRWAA